MAGKPKPMFFIAASIIIVALVGFAIYQARDIFAPEGEAGNAGKGGEVDPSKLGIPTTAEDTSDSSGITTVKEYSFVPNQRLPEVKGTAAYKPMADNTVRFALNVWAGWAPIIHANNGFKAEKVWKAPDGQSFKVELVLIDDPVAMFDAYSSGDVHIGWATLDMVPLFIERLGQTRDSRVMPRIFQQVDWSNGGDGIVVRGNVKNVADLRNQRVALAANSPSQYFLLNMLVAAGVQPSEIKPVYLSDAFQAAAAFDAEKDIAAAVSWAPDIYNLADVQGNKLLVTTAVANKLIADVWFARADFAKDHPAVIEGLVRGIFDAMVELKNDDAKKSVAELMAGGYGIPKTDALAMLADAHSTNWAENFQFFLNQNNPTNFERIWNQSYYLYRKIRAIKQPRVDFDQVMDFSIIKKLGEEEKYSSQRDEYTVQFVPKTTSEVQAEDEILTNTVVIHFSPNSWDLYKTVADKSKEEGAETLYDPNVDFVLEEIASLTGQFGAARVVIEGHTDSSMQGRVDEVVVLDLSSKRANAVKQALVEKFELDPNQLNAEGMGWRRPADPNDKLNQAKNRRVEIKIYPAEAGE
jgi:ABC-type nitrate/sulfonate/bicarbonate transport system substrate-binding protein